MMVFSQIAQLSVTILAIQIVHHSSTNAGIISTDVNEEENTVDININVNELLGKEQDSNSKCCFRYGFGSRMVPCCMKIISCDVYSEILEDMERNEIGLGGAIGKHKSCPKDAAHAHQLVSGGTVDTENKAKSRGLWQWFKDTGDSIVNFFDSDESISFSSEEYRYLKNITQNNPYPQQQYNPYPQQQYNPYPQQFHQQQLTNGFPQQFNQQQLTYQPINPNQQQSTLI